MSNFSRRQGNLACGLISLCLLLFRPSGANAEASPAKGESARINAEATSVDHAPKLDGTLNDLLWQSANPLWSSVNGNPTTASCQPRGRKYGFSTHDTPCISEFIVMTPSPRGSSRPNSGGT